MHQTTGSDARGYMKRSGFVFNKKPHQLDRMLLESLDPKDREILKNEWTMRNLNSTMSYAFTSNKSLYKIPRTREQAALLFSYDCQRAVASARWFDSIITTLQPASVVEMGCGAGFLLRYLRTRHRHVRFQGVDAAANLIIIAEEVSDQKLIAADYLTAKPDDLYDLLMCDFGFDNEDLSPSRSPHRVEKFRGLDLCRGCSDHLSGQLDAYVSSWRMWASPSGRLAVAGRMPNFDQVRALVLSAGRAGWTLSLRQSCVLQVRNIVNEKESFPALLFEPPHSSDHSPSIEAVADFYAAAT